MLTKEERITKIHSEFTRLKDCILRECRFADGTQQAFRKVEEAEILIVKVIEDSE